VVKFYQNFSWSFVCVELHPIANLIHDVNMLMTMMMQVLQDYSRTFLNYFLVSLEIADMLAP